MTENIYTPPTQPHDEQHGQPTLRRYLDLPKGVLQKNLKTFVYLGAVFLVIVAALFSSSGKKSPAQQAAAKGQPPQPTLQDNTDTNVQELKNQLQAERQNEQQAALAAAATADPALASATPAQQAAAATYGPTGLTVPCVPGRSCPQMQQANTQMQLSPEQQQVQMIAAKERERVDNSRFASNLVFSPSQQAQQQSQSTSSQYDPSDRPANSNLLKSPTKERQQPPETDPGGYKRPLEANIDSATGQPYLIYEGSVLDTVLMNRLDGDAVGPVKVLVSNPLYSHDHQHVIIPEGTVVLGEAKKIGAAGFGQQRRMAVAFHRLIMPDGYSVDLDQFHGLDQIGEEGLKDKVNNHYLQEGDIETLRRLLERMFQLRVRILERTPEWWVGYRDYLLERKGEMLDQTQAKLWFTHADRAINSGDIEALRTACRQLWSLLPKQLQMRGYGGGTVRARGTNV